VLAQLEQEGTPVILTGGVNDMLDMRAPGDVYAAPENRVMLVELAHLWPGRGQRFQAPRRTGGSRGQPFL
jgi:trimethylamine:corrinoid methyltransferase-like protein